MAPSSGREPDSGQEGTTFTVRDIHDWTTEQRCRRCEQLAIPVSQDEKPESLRRKLSQFLRHRSPPKTSTNGSKTVDPEVPRSRNTRQPTDSQVQPSDRAHVLHPGNHDQLGTPRHENGGRAREPMAENDGFQTPLGLERGPAIDQRAVEDTGLAQFEQANPFQLLEEEDEDEGAFFETYLRLQRKHRASPLATPADRPRVKPALRPTPLPMQAQTQPAKVPALPFTEDAAMGGVQTPRTGQLDVDSMRIDSGQDARHDQPETSTRVHASQVTTQHNSAQNCAQNDQESTANDSNAALQNQTADDQDRKACRKKKKTKKTATGATQKLTAMALATLEGLPDRPTLPLLRTVQDAGLKLLLHANGLPRQRGPDHKENKENMAQVLFAWLGADDRRILQLPAGLTRTQVPPMGPHAPSMENPDHNEQRRSPTQPTRQPKIPSKTTKTPPSTLDGLQSVLTNVADFLRSTMEWTERAHTAPADVIGDMGRSAANLLAQVRAAQGGIAAAEMLSPTAGQTGAKGGGTRTKPGQRSWADVARGVSTEDDVGAKNGSHYAKDLQQQHRFPERSQDWETSRCIVMEPTTDSQRTAPMAGPKFASAMHAFIKRMSPNAPTRSVELIRRTRRGGYQIQIFEAYFSQIRAALSPLTVTLTDFGSWTMTPTRDDHLKGPTVSIAIPRIPITMTMDEFLEEFRLNNAARYPESSNSILRDGVRSATRLSRRVTSESGRSWVPSSTVRLDVSKALGEAILSRGTIVFQFRSIAVRRYIPLTRTCFRCGKEGHEARFCRSAPRCRNCGKGHEVWRCPDRRRGPPSQDMDTLSPLEPQPETRDRGMGPHEDTCC